MNLVVTASSSDESDRSCRKCGQYFAMPPPSCRRQRFSGRADGCRNGWRHGRHDVSQKPELELILRKEQLLFSMQKVQGRKLHLHRMDHGISFCPIHSWHTEGGRGRSTDPPRRVETDGFRVPRFALCASPRSGRQRRWWIGDGQRRKLSCPL